MRLALISLPLAAGLIASCSDGGVAPEAQSTATGVEARATAPQPGLSGYDMDSMLFVKGRDRLRACVEVLDSSVEVQAAADAVQTALETAAENERWPDDWGAPATTIGCPLPPVALEETGKPFPERHVCSAGVSRYLVFAFVGEAPLFEERFPKDWLDVALVPGLRHAIQERLSTGGSSECVHDVSEAWYLTPDDVEDQMVLERYALNIFPIADVGVR